MSYTENPGKKISYIRFYEQNNWRPDDTPPYEWELLPAVMRYTTPANSEIQEVNMDSLGGSAYFISLLEENSAKVSFTDTEHQYFTPADGIPAYEVSNNDCLLANGTGSSVVTEPSYVLDMSSNVKTVSAGTVFFLSFTVTERAYAPSLNVVSGGENASVVSSTVTTDDDGNKILEFSISISAAGTYRFVPAYYYTFATGDLNEKYRTGGYYVDIEVTE